jgi:hypothetical protein
LHFLKILLIYAACGVDPPCYLIDVYADFLHFGGDGFQVGVVGVYRIAVNQHFPGIRTEVVCVKPAHFIVNKIALRFRDSKPQDDFALAVDRVIAVPHALTLLCFSYFRGFGTLPKNEGSGNFPTSETNAP